MFRRVTVSNFRCLQGISVPLAPLTVLVGANATGKSTLLRALNPVTSFTLQDVSHHRQDLKLEVRLESEDGVIIHTFEASAGTRHVGLRPDVTSQLIRLDLNHLREANHVQQELHLVPTGKNCANVFSSIGRGKQIEIAKRLSELVPTLADVEVRPAHTAGYQTIYFQDRWHPSTWYAPSEISDGTMLMLAYLILQYQTPAPAILGVEEPERGLHPYLIGQLVCFLRELSAGKLGPQPVQVVLATHSAELLDHVRPEEVVFLDRQESDGSVKARKPPTDDSGWSSAFKEYKESLGAAWLSGTLGGVPSFSP